MAEVKHDRSLIEAFTKAWHFDASVSDANAQWLRYLPESRSDLRAQSREILRVLRERGYEVRRVKP